MNTQTSPSLHEAIAAHQAAQAQVDATDSAQADDFAGVLDAEDDVHWRLANTPCTSVADFLAKILHLRGARAPQLGRPILA
jgi:hypothetical protein